MASKVRNNCPTSDREGTCIHGGIHLETARELSSTNGLCFTPDMRDRLALAAAPPEIYNAFGFTSREAYGMLCYYLLYKSRLQVDDVHDDYDDGIYLEDCC